MYSKNIITFIFLFSALAPAWSEQNEHDEQRITLEKALERFDKELSRIDGDALLTDLMMCRETDDIPEHLMALKLKEKLLKEYKVIKRGYYVPKSKELELFGGRVVKLHPYFGMSPGWSIFIEAPPEKVVSEAKKHIELSTNDCKETQNGIWCKKTITETRSFHIMSTSISERDQRYIRIPINTKIVAVGCLYPYRK